MPPPTKVSQVFSVYIVPTHQQGKKRAQSSPGLKPDCDNCAKALKLCKWPPPSWARVCWLCKVSKLKCTVGGVPQSMKRAKLAPPDEAGPSKAPLFMESKPEEELALEMSEVSPAGLAELEGAIRAASTDHCASGPACDPGVAGQQDGVRGCRAQWTLYCDGGAAGSFD